jgi:hypothetical protein
MSPKRFQAKHALGQNRVFAPDDPGVETGSRQENASNLETTAEMNRAPVRRPISCLQGKLAFQSQFLNFQALSFHGVSVSRRHCTNRSGGQ